MVKEIAAPEGAIVNTKAEPEALVEGAAPRVKRRRKKVSSQPADAVQVEASVSSDDGSIEVTLNRLNSMKNNLVAEIAKLENQLAGKLSTQVKDGKVVAQPNRSLQECNQQYYELSRKEAEEKVQTAETVKQMFTGHVNLKTGEKVVRRIQRALT